MRAGQPAMRRARAGVRRPRPGGRSGRRSRGSRQSAIWAEIDAKSAGMGAASETRAAAAMFEQKQHEVEGFTRALQPVESQVGAIFAIRGVIAGLDAFDAPQTWM